MRTPLSDDALDTFLRSWFTGMGKTGGLDAQQTARYRPILVNALAAMNAVGEPAPAGTSPVKPGQAD